MITSLVGDRVLVAPISQREHETTSGLYTVEDEAPDVMGTVVVCSPAHEDVKVDDVVIFSPQSGQRVEYDGSSYLILQTDEILGVLE